ncbi:patatin-like phospholipase domain-containing protein 1-like protein [Willisornis vidua]|uniref:Patatin-like phospholipase domain-containing protein 1-like protein n=1 Tax=Willisornis vidua TaxID=1566151 RepID=A0ABQ9DQH9_9PASS|nr:patatin-like phospholipase domain-containing protein 1-like protein [Willisornis vidua]
MMRISGKEGRPYSILFRGCSFLVIYEAGVLSALLDLSPDVLKSASRIYGSSSGSIIAAGGLCGCDVEEVKEAFFRGIKTCFWGLIPGGRVLRLVRSVLEKYLPPNAHELVSGKLHIVLTRVHDWKSVTVSEFSSKEDLIQRYMDGELGLWRSDFVSRTTITVSAFAGEYDICPKDSPAAFLTFQLADCILHISKRNLCRLLYIFQLPSREVHNRFFAQGYQDTVSFFQRLSKWLGVRSRKVGSFSYLVGLLTEVDFPMDYFEGFTLSFTDGSQQKGEDTLYLKPELRGLRFSATDPEDVTEENPGTIPAEEEEEAPQNLLHPQKGPGQPQKSIFGPAAASDPSLHFKKRMKNLQPSLKAEPHLH